MSISIVLLHQLPFFSHSLNFPSQLKIIWETTEEKIYICTYDQSQLFQTKKNIFMLQFFRYNF